MSKALVVFKGEKFFEHLKQNYPNISFLIEMDPSNIEKRLTEEEFNLIFFQFDLKDTIDFAETKKAIKILTKSTVKARVIGLFTNASGKESIISYAIKQGIHDFIADIYGMEFNPASVRELIVNPKTRNEVKQCIIDDFDCENNEEHHDVIEKHINVIQRQRVFSVMGNKGSGITELAINLAYSIAKKYNNDSIVILDLDIKKADIALKLQTDKNKNSLHTLIDSLKSNTLNNKVMTDHLYQPDSEYGVYLLNGFINIQEFTEIEPQHIHRLISICRNMFDVVIINTSGNMNNLIVRECYYLSSHIFVSLASNLPDLKYYKRTMLANEVSGIKIDFSKTSAVFSKYYPLKSFDPGDLAKGVGFDSFYTIRYIPQYNDYINDGNIAVLQNDILFADYSNIISNFFIQVEQKKKRFSFSIKKFFKQL